MLREAKRAYQSQDRKTERQLFNKILDMLRAERALRDGLPIIERLVLALPPLDPEPSPRAGVIALRRPRRRR